MQSRSFSLSLQDISSPSTHHGGLEPMSMEIPGHLLYWHPWGFVRCIAMRKILNVCPGPKCQSFHTSLPQNTMADPVWLHIYNWQANCAMCGCGSCMMEEKTECLHPGNPILTPSASIQHPRGTRFTLEGNFRSQSPPQSKGTFVLKPLLSWWVCSYLHQLIAW